MYLENLKSASVHQLPTNTTSPKNLKELLLEIESKLPNNFELLRNPRKDIWYFYITLTCITYVEDSEIRFVIKIPLMNTKEKYEVYKVHNLSVSLHHVSAESNNDLVKYNLKTKMLMISEGRTKCSLLSESTY